MKSRAFFYSFKTRVTLVLILAMVLFMLLVFPLLLAVPVETILRLSVLSSSCSWPNVVLRASSARLLISFFFMETDFIITYYL